MTRLIRHVLPLALVGAAALAPALSAKPAPIAAALADPARSDANRQLDEGRRPAEVLAFAGIKRGDVVADYQAGGGYYSELLADVAGAKGRVYALNQPNFYDTKVWDPLIKAHPQVSPLVGPGQTLVLAPRSVDAIFAHLTYHDLYWVNEKYQHPKIDVPVFLAGWFAAVRPGGQVIIIDHAANPGDVLETVDKLHRIDPERVKADMAAAGFVLEAESNVLRRNEDDRSKLVFDPAVRGKTDRFVLKFRRP